MTTAVDLKDEKVIRVARSMCLESFEFFTKYFFLKQYLKKFVWNDHHGIIINALEDVLLGKCLRLIIEVAPRYSKTEIAVKAFISHGIALNPSAKFIHLSYGDNIALDNSETIKDLIESEAYQELFPGVSVKKDSKSKEKWYTNHGGGVLARSASGQVTGFGAGQVDEEFDIMNFADKIAKQDADTAISKLEKKMKFAGAIIIDDSIKPEDADQDTIRNRVNSRFDSTIRNRVNSRNTPIIVIQQRLHPMDLPGYLQRKEESDEWRVISLPCIKEDGTALWPFKHTIKELLALKKANEIVFERQYMQNPQPKTGLMFPTSSLHFYNPMELVKLLDQREDRGKPDFVYIAGDPANLGGDDFAAVAAWLVGDKIYIQDVLYNLEGADVNEVNVVAMTLRNKAHAVGIEGVFGWDSTVKRIRADLDRKNYTGEVRCLRPRTSKHVRISARSSFIINHFIFRSDYESMPQYSKFMRNLTSYKKVQEVGKLNKHDEAPDVCEMVASYFEKQFPEIWENAA